MTVAGFDVLPSLSCTVYWMGVGSPVKPGAGVKVMAPVVVFTLQVPWPGTTRETPGAGVPTICTVEGTVASPVVSLLSTGTVTAVPVALPLELSFARHGHVVDRDRGLIGGPCLPRPEPYR